MAKLVIANFKSNKTLSEMNDWLKVFLTPSLKLLLKKKALELALAPPFVFVSEVALATGDFLKVKLAVQDLSPYPAGSYTGAVSAYNLKDWPVKYVILGHSERRRYFHETDNDVALKVEQALANKIVPIVCVDDETYRSQATTLPESVWQECVIAYEPKESIGTGLAADTDKVSAMVKKIKQLYGQQTKVLYGGSVSELNVNDYLAVSDGVLVGSISLEPERLIALLRAIYEPTEFI